MPPLLDLRQGGAACMKQNAIVGKQTGENSNEGA